jgi:hypothetical protein
LNEFISGDELVLYNCEKNPSLFGFIGVDVE